MRFPKDTAQGANIWGLKFGSVAQQVVHFAVNKKVDGSNPSRTVYYKFKIFRATQILTAEYHNLKQYKDTLTI